MKCRPILPTPSPNCYIMRRIQHQRELFMKDRETAKKYIDAGALWNGGVFAFKLSYVLEIAKERLGSDNYEELFQKYDSLQKISFDYAVVEKEKSINDLLHPRDGPDLAK